MQGQFPLNAYASHGRDKMTDVTGIDRSVLTAVMQQTASAQALVSSIFSALLILLDF